MQLYPRACSHGHMGVQAVDLHFMAALSKEVALIPVIAKSDSMTTPELVAFKSEVVQRLQDPRIDGAPLDWSPGMQSLAYICDCSARQLHNP